MRLTVLRIFIAAACACAPKFDGRVYRGDGFAFAVPPLSPTWRPLRDRDAALAYREPESQATVLVNARCGLSTDDVPLASLTHHLFIDFTKRSIDAQEVVPLDGREAMHTRMSALLDGVPMRYDVWVMKKDGCVYDLLYFAPPETFERGLPRFDALVRGFTTAVPHD